MLVFCKQHLYPHSSIIYSSINCGPGLSLVIVCIETSGIRNQPWLWYSCNDKLQSIGPKCVSDCESRLIVREKISMCLLSLFYTVLFTHIWEAIIITTCLWYHKSLLFILKTPKLVLIVLAVFRLVQTDTIIKKMSGSILLHSWYAQSVDALSRLGCAVWHICSKYYKLVSPCL